MLKQAEPEIKGLSALCSINTACCFMDATLTWDMTVVTGTMLCLFYHVTQTIHLLWCRIKDIFVSFFVDELTADINSVS